MFAAYRISQSIRTSVIASCKYDISDKRGFISFKETPKRWIDQYVQGENQSISILQIATISRISSSFLGSSWWRKTSFCWHYTCTSKCRVSFQLARMWRKSFMYTPPCCPTIQAIYSHHVLQWPILQWYWGRLRMWESWAAIQRVIVILEWQALLDLSLQSILTVGKNPCDIASFIYQPPQLPFSTLHSYSSCWRECQKQDP